MTITSTPPATDYIYSFDAEGTQTIYRNEAIIICGEKLVQMRENSLATSGAVVKINMGMDTLYITAA